MKDWQTIILSILVSVAISVLASLFIIDNNPKPQKIVVIDFARDIAAMVNDGLITDENRQQVLTEMLKQSEQFASEGYIILNKAAVLAAPEQYKYKHYEPKK